MTSDLQGHRAGREPDSTRTRNLSKSAGVPLFVWAPWGKGGHIGPPPTTPERNPPPVGYPRAATVLDAAGAPDAPREVTLARPLQVARGPAPSIVPLARGLPRIARQVSPDRIGHRLSYTPLATGI